MIAPHPDPAPPADTPPPTVTLRPTGFTQVGGYRIVREVARGGMGVVYEGFDPRLRRRVAVKMLAPDAAADAEAFARFAVEAETAAKSQHPNVVQVYEVGWQDGQPFVALEFLPGGNLHARTAGKPQPPTWAAEVVRAVARGVSHAHQCGVVHRDVKPANILFDAAGVPKVTDFGAARHMAPDPDRPAVTRAGTVIGTPQYMAPEQARGATAGPAADVYSLGAVLYHLLTGRPPFDGPEPIEVMTQAVTTEPVRPRALVPHVPKPLETVCLKCLEKAPGRRYPSAAALADDLDRFLHGESVLARPDGPVARAAKQARRRPLEAALTAALFLAVALGVSGVTWQWRVAERSAAAALAAQEQEGEAREQAERRKDAAEDALYRSRLAQAAVLIRDDDAVHAARLLAAHDRPDRRQWEFHHLTALTNQHLWEQGFAGLNDWPRRATVSPDGRWAVVTGGDPYKDGHHWDRTAPTQVRVYNAVDGTPVARWTDALAAGADHAVWLGPDALVLAGADVGRAGLKVFRVPGGEELFELPRPAGCGTPAVSTDGRWAARALPGGRLEVVALPSGDRAAVMTVPDAARAVALRGPDRVAVVTARPGGKPDETVAGAVLVDPRAGRVVAALSDAEAPFAFAPDGRTLVGRLGDGAGGWDADTGTALWRDHRPGWPREPFGFTPDGETVIDHGFWMSPIRLRSARTGQVRCELRGHPSVRYGVAVSPDGRSLATAGGDGTVRLWDVHGGERMRLRAHPTGVRAVGFDPTGHRLITGGIDGTVRAWDLTREGTDGDALPKPFVGGGGPGTLGGLWPLPDGRVRVLETTCGQLVDLDPATYTPARAVRLTDMNARADGQFTDFSQTPDGRFLVGPACDGRPAVWRTDTGAVVRRFPDLEGVVYSSAVRADGGQAAFCFRPPGKDSPRRLVVADADTGRVVREEVMYQHYYPCMTYLPDGRLALGLTYRTETDSGVEVIDPSGARPPQLLATEGRSTMLFVAVSPDGRRLAGYDLRGPAPDGRLCLWDLESGGPVWTVRVARGASAVSFSPDGRRIAAARTNDTMQLYDATTGAEVLVRKIDSPRNGTPSFPARAVFTADGRRLVALHAFGTLSVWSSADPARTAEERAADRRVEADAARYAAHLRAATDLRDHPFGVGFRHHARYLDELPAPNPFLAAEWADLRRKAGAKLAAGAAAGGWAVGR